MKRALGVFPKVVFAALGLIFVATAVFVGIAAKESDAAESSISYTTDYIQGESVNYAPYDGLTHKHIINGERAWCAQHYRTSAVSGTKLKGKTVNVIEDGDGRTIFDDINLGNNSSDLNDRFLFRALYYINKTGKVNDTEGLDGIDKDLVLHLTLSYATNPSMFDNNIISDGNWAPRKKAKEYYRWLNEDEDAAFPNNIENATVTSWAVDGNENSYQKLLTYSYDETPVTPNNDVVEFTVKKIWSGVTGANKPTHIEFYVSTSPDGETIAKNVDGDDASCFILRGDSDEQTCSVKDLPKYDEEGQKIKYYVKYEYIGRRDNGIGHDGEWPFGKRINETKTIDNVTHDKYKPDRVICNQEEYTCELYNIYSNKRDFKIAKTWSDYGNVEKTRPSRIYIYLYKKINSDYANGECTEAPTIFSDAQIIDFDSGEHEDALYHGKWCAVDDFVFETSDDYSKIYTTDKIYDEYYTYKEDDEGHYEGQVSDVPIDYMVAEVLGSSLTPDKPMYYNVYDSSGAHYFMNNEDVCLNYQGGGVWGDCAEGNDLYLSFMEKNTYLDEFEGLADFRFDNGYDIYTKALFKKVWKDAGDGDEKRPKSISLKVKAYKINDEGEKVETCFRTHCGEESITLSDSKNWTAESSNFSKYYEDSNHKPHLVQIEVEEVTVDGYTGLVETIPPCVEGLVQETCSESGVWEFVLTNTKDVEYVDLSVEKKWDEPGQIDPDYRRNAEIGIKIKANGQEIDLEGNSIKLNRGNGFSWNLADSDLPENIKNKFRRYDDEGNEIQYDIEEEFSSVFYENDPDPSCTRKDGTNEWICTATNTYNNETSINLKKIWRDDEATANSPRRPESITFTIESSDPNYEHDPVVLRRADYPNTNEWTYVIEGLPKYNLNGDLITYTISEPEISGYDGAKSCTASGEANECVITNSLLTNLAIEKTWIAPASYSKPELTFHIKANGEDIKVEDMYGGDEATKNQIVNGVTLNSSNAVPMNTSKWTWDSLSVGVRFRAYDTDGNEINYSIVEDAIESASMTEDPSCSRNNNVWVCEVSNEVQEKISLKLNKTWDESSLSSLSEEERAAAISEREANGAIFSIIGGYSLDYGGADSKTICSVQIKKNEIDIVRITKDGVVSDSNACENIDGSKGIEVRKGEGEYSAVISGLNRYRRGTDIQYIIYEVPKLGKSLWSATASSYQAAPVDESTKSTSVSITNTYHAKTNVRINKCWVDNDNAYSTRPQTISFDLYRLKKSSGSAEFVVDESFAPREVVLNGSKVDNNCWYEEVNDLDVATGGDEYKYEFQEKIELLEGFDYESINNGSCITTEQDGNCTVTNALTGELEMSGTKTWIDDNDSQGVRPENLELILERATDGVTYEGGSNYMIVHDATPTWTKNGNVWSYKYSNLAKYDEQGRKYLYRVKEDTNSNGAVDAKNCTQENLNNCDKYVSQETGEENNFKNLLTGKVNYKGKKVWEDSEAPSNFRPEEITVNLYKNGVQFKTTTVTASKDGDKDVWEFEFTDLDKYDDNGKLISYTIDENAIDQYLTEVNQTENTIYNTYNSDKTSVEARKVWKDDKESDRPGKIELTLMRKEDGEWKHYAVASLSKDNDWRYIFEDLDANYEYEILEEIQVPGYYPGVYRACEGDSSAPICYEVENRFIQPTPDTGERNPFSVLMFATPAIVFGGWFAARKLMGRR